MRFRDIFTAVALLIGCGSKQLCLAQTIDAHDLKTVITEVYYHHPQVKALKAELRGQSEVIAEAKANYHPQIILDGSLNASDRTAVLRDGTSFDQNNQPISVGLRLNYTLFDGGRRKLFSQNAATTYKASEQQFEANRLSIAQSVIETYISLVAAIEEGRILNDSLASLESLNKSIIARYEFGDSTKIDISRAKSQVANAHASLARNRATIKTLQANIKSLSGLNVSSPRLPIEATVPINLNLEQLKIAAKQNSSQLKATRLNERAAQINLSSEKRKIFPTITLTASASSTQDSSPTIDSDDDLNVGVRLSLPLYSGGLGQSQSRRALANVNAAAYRHIDSIREIELLIERIWTDIETSKVIIDAQKENLEASQESLKGTSLSEEVGISSLEDVLRANDIKLNSEISLSRATHSLYTSRLLLKLHTGEFDLAPI